MLAGWQIYSLIGEGMERLGDLAPSCMRLDNGIYESAIHREVGLPIQIATQPPLTSSDP